MGGAVLLGGEYISKQIIANSHNNLYRGELLYDATTSTAGHFASIQELQVAVDLGDFSDIYIGDYIITWDPTTGHVSTTQWLVAGINVLSCYAMTGTTSSDGGTYRPHLALIPRQCFHYPYKMHSSNNNKSGYYNTSLNKTDLPALGANLRESGYFENALHYALHMMSKSGNSSGATGSNWYGTYLILPSEVSLFSTALRQNQFDTLNNLQFQLPLFRLRPDLIFDVSRGYWLSTIPKTGNTVFCNIKTEGDVTSTTATTESGLRPIAIFV